MEEDKRFRSLESIIRDMYAESVATGTGRISGSRSPSFRQSSKSNSTGQHNHGLDIGARRNYAHELAAKRKSEADRKNRENEIHRRETEFIKRKEEMLQHAKTSHKNIYHSEEIDPNAGTSARVKIKNVSRPDDPEPTSPKSKLSKTTEIIRKIIEEKQMSLLTNLGSPESLIKSVRSVLEAKKDDAVDNKDARKLHGGKTKVDTKPQLTMREELSDKQKKLAATSGDKDKIDAGDFKALRGKKCPECGKVKCDCDDVKEEVNISEDNTSKYPVSYEKGMHDKSHHVMNTHLDLTKSPDYKPGEKITSPARVTYLVKNHPKHKEIKDRGFHLKKYGEHSSSAFGGKTTNEEVEVIDERELTPAEMKKREEYVKGMKSKAAGFEKKYPGRGKEVMYATATKMAKEETEEIDEGTPADYKKQLVNIAKKEKKLPAGISAERKALTIQKQKIQKLHAASMKNEEVELTAEEIETLNKIFSEFTEE